MRLAGDRGADDTLLTMLPALCADSTCELWNGLKWVALPLPLPNPHPRHPCCTPGSPPHPCCPPLLHTPPRLDPLPLLHPRLTVSRADLPWLQVVHPPPPGL